MKRMRIEHGCIKSKKFFPDGNCEKVIRFQRFISLLYHMLHIIQGLNRADPDDELPSNHTVNGIKIQLLENVSEIWNFTHPKFIDVGFHFGVSEVRRKKFFPWNKVPRANRSACAFISTHPETEK